MKQRPSDASGPGLSGDQPVVVVGAGAVGLAIAYYLADAGIRVEVVERHTVGSATSWGNAGWVCAALSAPIPSPGVVGFALRSMGRPTSPVYLRPFPDPRFIAWMWRFWRHTNTAKFAHGYEAVAELNRTTFDLFDDLRAQGTETTLSRPGMAHGFLTAAGARASLEVQQRMAPGRYAMPDDIVEGPDAADLDPAFTTQVKAGYVVEGEGVLDPAAFSAALAKAVTERGGRIREHTDVTGFREVGGRVIAVETTAGDIECEAVAIAAGPWSATLLRTLGHRIPMQAGKGYSFTVDLETPPVHTLYLSDRRIAVSPLAGSTRFSGTMEFSGNNRRMDWRRIVAIATGSREFLGPWFDNPDDLAVRIREPWVGARPILPDGLPLIDRVANGSNVFAATGHGMLGITLAPATGFNLAEHMISGRRPGVLEPFRIRR